MLYIGIDDTDIKESRGTGNLARRIAGILSSDFAIHGVVRHQLLEDPRVPCTSKNSSACIAIEYDHKDIPEGLFEAVKNIMLSDFYPGSDPGLCITSHVPEEITAFGLKTKSQLVKQDEARNLAKSFSIQLEGLGGTNDGIIGALASVGLCASGDDGRYVQYGSIRDLKGQLSVKDILGAGIREVRTLNEKPVTSGVILSEKLRPSRRNAVPIVYVEKNHGHWVPLKIN